MQCPTRLDKLRHMTAVFFESFVTHVHAPLPLWGPIGSAGLHPFFFAQLERVVLILVGICSGRRRRPMCVDREGERGCTVVPAEKRLIGRVRTPLLLLWLVVGVGPSFTPSYAQAERVCLIPVGAPTGPFSRRRRHHTSVRRCCGCCCSGCGG